MELSNSKIKRFFIFSQKSPQQFSAQVQKRKKIHPPKNSLYFRKWNFLALILQKFQETKTRKKSPYISENGNPKKASYILENGTFQPKLKKTKKPASKKFLIFWEMELFNSKIKSFLIFSYISGNGNFLKKSPQFFGNWNFKKIFIFQETRFSFQ